MHNAAFSFGSTFVDFFPDNAVDNVFLIHESPRLVVIDKKKVTRGSSF